MKARISQVITQTTVQGCMAATIAFSVYLRTLAPTVMWYDMGEFATAAYVLGIAHNTGYPLYILLGKLFTYLPVGDVAYRVNLMSAFFAALTVFLVFRIVERLTQKQSAAWLAALTIAFSSTLWANATWAVSYDLNAFLTALIFWLFVRWQEEGSRKFINLAGLIFGLSLGNHRLILIVFLPGLYLIWHMAHNRVDRLGWKGIVTLGGLILIGFSINLYLPLRAAQEPAYMWADASDPDTLLRMLFVGATDRSTFINPFRNLATRRIWLTTLTRFPTYELTLPGLLLAVIGGHWLFRRKRPVFLSSTLAMLLTLVMISVYGIHNIFNYFLPIYIFLAIWIGCGAVQIFTWIDTSLPREIDSQIAILRPKFRTAILLFLCFLIPFSLFIRNFSRLDRSQHRHAGDFAHYLFTKLEDNAIVLADFWSWAPLMYTQLVEGEGREIAVLPALSDSDVDQIHFLDVLQEAGATVYVAVSAEDTPRLQIEPQRLQLVAPYVIQGMTTPRQPLPEYKDLLVPSGMLYRAVSSPPDLTFDEALVERSMEVVFSGEIALVGFEIQPVSVKPGESFQASYDWLLIQDTGNNYWVDILFTDCDGNVITESGFPLWLHSHWVGALANPTSTWPAGTIQREVLDGIVPREIPAGTYQIRAFLYRGIRENPVKVDGVESSQEGVLLGMIQILGD